jgi:hypothetical protein
MRQEEKKYSRLLMELNKSCSFAQSGLYQGSERSDFAKYSVDQTMDENLSSDLEVTRLTGDEILYGGGLTMEQVLLKRNKPPDWDVGKHSQKSGNQYREARRSIESPPERDVSISWITGQIRNADVEAFGNDEMKEEDLNRLQHEVGESHSIKLQSSGSASDPPWQDARECDSTAVDDSTGPPSGWRYRYWCHDLGWQNSNLSIPLSTGLPPDCLAEQDSDVVESVRLNLQRWSRVYSFSSTTCCTWKIGEHEIVYRLHTGENKST